MLTRKKVRNNLLLVFGIIVLANIIAARFFFRLDFTEDKRYSLSNATEDILEKLKDPITITAYFTEELPPAIAKIRQDFNDLLIEYDNLSNGQVVFEFVNPNENEQTEMETQQKGIRPMMVNVRERDQMKQQRVYMGAILQMGSQSEVIPFIQQGAGVEYLLSSSIKKLTITNKPKVALLQGHGEPSMNAIQQLYQSLSVTHDVQPVTLTDSSGIPADINLLAVIAPKDSVPPAHLRYLDEFLARGGKMMFALNRVDRNAQTGSGDLISTGFENWLKDRGIEVEGKFVTDISCGTVYVTQQTGTFQFNTPIQFPYFPVLKTFPDHPITNGLEAVILPFASPINYFPKDSSVKYTPIAVTSEKSGAETPPVYFDVSKNWTMAEFTQSSQPVAVAVEGKINGNSYSRMVVFGDGDFVVNGEGQQAQQLQPDNINLMVNAIDWLSDDTGLIELRTKGITSRPIDPTIEDGTKSLIKYVNFLLPIVAIILYGFYRFQLRRKLSAKLMATEYVEQ